MKTLITLLLLIPSLIWGKQEICDKTLIDIYGNPYVSSEEDAFPLNLSLAFL